MEYVYSEYTLVGIRTKGSYWKFKRGIINKSGETILPIKYDCKKITFLEKENLFGIITQPQRPPSGYVSTKGVEYWED